MHHPLKNKRMMNFTRIWCAGNGGNSAYSYLESYSSVISVGGTDINNRIYSGSQHNDQVDISAPGVDAKSTMDSTNDYSYCTGTSMATPHASGAALLLWNNNPECTNADIRKL